MIAPQGCRNAFFESLILEQTQLGQYSVNTFEIA